MRACSFGMIAAVSTTVAACGGTPRQLQHATVGVDVLSRLSRQHLFCGQLRRAWKGTRMSAAARGRETSKGEGIVYGGEATGK